MGIVQTNKLMSSDIFNVFIPECLQLQTLPFFRLVWHFLLLMLLFLLTILERVSVVVVAQLLLVRVVGSVLDCWEWERWEM